MAQAISNDTGLDVSPEFIKSGKMYKRYSKKKGGPDSKDEKTKRQNEVYKLHFEYGYSARKISELMNVNRNTINSDIDYWYGKISEKHNYFNPEPSIVTHFQRLNVQRSRLRENLDNTKDFSQRHAIEKMILDIDCKIINTQMKLAFSLQRIYDVKVESLNDWLKDKGDTNRYLSLFDKVSVSVQAQKKISDIINEDRKKLDPNF